MHQSEQDILDENVVIERAKNDPEAFGLLYEKYYKEIFYFVNRRVDEVGLVGDLTSQVFLKAMVNLSKYKFKGLPFSAWLYRIAANQVNEHYRKSNNQRVVSLEDGHIKRLFAEVEEQKEDKTVLLVKLLDQLDEQEVQILELRFFEEKPFKEVAYILDISENNAKVRTYRILDKLKKIAKAGLPGGYGL